MRDGPADRAGIDEGNRLAEIDGVSLRVDPSDIGRSGASDGAIRRMTRTLRGLRDGEQASIRVFSGGRFRNVTVQVGSSNAPNGLTAGSITVSPPTTPPTAIAVGSDQPNRPATVAGALQSLTDLQTQLRRLSDDGNGPLGNSSSVGARYLPQSNRIRSAQEIRRRTTISDRSASSAKHRPSGAHAESVSDDLARLFGGSSADYSCSGEVQPDFDPQRDVRSALTAPVTPTTSCRARLHTDQRESTAPPPSSNESHQPGRE